MTDSAASTAQGRWSIASAFVDRQTYKNLGYLLLALPFGFVYGTVLGFGLVAGIFLMFVGVGIVILLVTLGGVRLLARFERWLANVLLTVDLTAPDDRPRQEGLPATVVSALDAPSTWRGLGFLSIKFWFSIIALMFLIALATTIELLTAPLRYPTTVEFVTVNDEPITWTIETAPEAFVALPIGGVLLGGLLLLSNGIAYVAERAAAALLGDTSR